MRVSFQRATESDADELIRVQNAAFSDDLRKYGECPSYIESRDVMLEKIRSAIFYKILADEEVVGGVEIHPRTESLYHLYMLCVHPDYHDKGIGSRALEFIFGAHPEARTWTLVTPADNSRNCHLYEKAGFGQIGQRVRSEVLTLARYMKGDAAMKIVVVNGSPRAEKGNTQVLTDAFLAGAAEMGAVSETIYLKGKHIEYCCGDFHCWLRTPGVCRFNDDMPALLEKLRGADMVVFASPLYIYTVTGMMKVFMDRMLPLVTPQVQIEDGLSNHARRYGDNNKSYVLISNCGFPEQDHFSGLKETIRRCFRGDAQGLAGMICCAGGEMLRNPGLKDGLQWYLDAVKQAGREVVRGGCISPETQAIIDRPLMEDQQVFAEMTNAYFNSVLASLEAKGDEQTDNGAGELLPPPTSMDTVRDLVAGMAMVFNAEAAGDMRASVQFEVKDEEPGEYYLTIADGKCAAYAGRHPKPTATVVTPADVWLKIARKEMNGATAFMTGKYRVKGDLTLLMKFEKLFPSPQ